MDYGNFRKEIKLSNLLFYCSFSIFFHLSRLASFNFFCSPQPQVTGLQKLKLWTTLDGNTDLRRKKALTWDAIFLLHIILLICLKEGNFLILVGHNANVPC